jgi:hypothetical protein
MAIGANKSPARVAGSDFASGECKAVDLTTAAQSPPVVQREPTSGVNAAGKG